MRLLKAIKSTFEAIGIMTFILTMFLYFEQSAEILPRDVLIAGGVSVFLVWLTNKIFRWQADHFEVEECPWCGATLEWEEVKENEQSY